MGDILPFARSEAITLNGLHQHHGGLALGLHGQLEGLVHLERIMAAAIKLDDLVVGHARDEFHRLRVLAEKFLANIIHTAHFEGLVLAVQALFHALQQHAALVAPQQLIPAGAPDHLDHIPARTAESGFQFLDDLAVAAHRAIQALQVAVHHKNQVVQLLARSQSQRAQRLRLVRFAVTQEGPHLAPGGRNEAAVFEIAQEARMIDRVDRPQAHGNGRELPEVRHQPGVRITAEPGRVAQLVAEVLEVLFGETAFHKGPRIDARRSVALKIDHVSRLVTIGTAEEMMKGDLHEGRL